MASGVERFLDSQARLVVWPSKQQDKQLVCEYLATKFVVGQSYNEVEVNDLLKAWHTFSDWPLLRRELYDRRLLDRNTDGSDYCRPGVMI